MSGQVRGVTGWAVDRMVRRAVRRSFHTVSWLKPMETLPRPSILVANHHGWHDGYLMYLAARSLDLPVVDWIEEFDAFPLFGSIGGMPFPTGDSIRRSQTIRKTIRMMRDSQTSLILFAEGILHRPEALLPFGKSLELVASKVPQVAIIPVAIRYEHSLHERPEAFIAFGQPIAPGDSLAFRTRLEVAALLDRLKAAILLEPGRFEVMAQGTKDVNERLDMRRIPFRKADSKQ